MKKIFFISSFIIFFTILFCANNLLAINKLVIWSTIDQKIENKNTINELYNFLEKNHENIFKNIKINELEVPHIAIAIAGIIKEENGEKYILNNKNKKILLKDVISAIEKAISDNKIEKSDLDQAKFNLKPGSRFSKPINEKQFYIIQKPLLKKNHYIYTIAKSIKKELSDIGLNPEIFKPLVSSTHVYSNDKKTINKLQYLQNYPKFFKILKDVPESNGLTCSNIEILIDSANNYDIIKTFDLKK
ncbi:MAG: hypothetical protein UR12_C0018G0012 [candidate division TM6 bacterium GW2011_GWF2_30_66]|jgi:hypothetical protein|nr:MAG: hypothetical protein UR12_C0018G0012 [candidate division TM6 bacterium GW2011_GWF2_30_66]